MRFTFRKEERLYSKKIIAELMSRGKSFSNNPLRIVWTETELAGKFPAQVLFSVPQKKIKTSVQRNRLKRRMREAYRKNKQILYEPLKESGIAIAFAIIYTSPKESEYGDIERKIILSLHRLRDNVINSRL